MTKAKMVLKQALGVLALGLATPAFAAVNIVTNGGFELGTNPGSYSQVDAGETDIQDWNVASGSVDYIGSYWQAQGGSRSIDLAGSSIGSIYQDLATIIGQAYELNFYISKNPDGGAATRTGTVSFGDAPGQSAGFAYSSSNSTGNMNWVLQTLYFVATASTTRLQFSADASAGCCFGPALDTVSVVAAPEPATWAMLLLGFGIAGASLRRRRKQPQGGLAFA